MNVEKNMPLKVRIESQHYWTAGILYQGTLIYELCNITYILPFKKLKTKSIFFKKNFLWTSSATHYPEISVGSVVSPKNWIAPPL